MTVRGQIVDLEKREIYHGEVEVKEGRVAAVRRTEGSGGNYLMPGFIDAHIHIESSMLVPSEFARLAVLHGTVATVSDPHEIANVLGVEGVEYMIENGRKVPFKFFFGAPSCVPATTFETSGARIGSDGIELLLQKPEIKYLAEMMNYPGVLNGDPEVKEKLEIARRIGKPIDGHAPGLRGKKIVRYIEAGISTDHESFTYDEALEKLQHGMKVLIREGSAARNFDALIGLLPDYPDRIMFCSDDKHPDDLVEGHINQLAARAVGAGFDLFQVLRAACLNPILHYDLDVGRLREGDPADFIEVEDLENFGVLSTYINGQKVAAYNETLIDRTEAPVVNRFQASPTRPADFQIPARSTHCRVIQVIDGELVTGSFTATVRVENGQAVSDPQRDILKMAVINRYSEAPPALGFVQGFRLQAGAIASSVAHDSHNIVAVGVDDESLSRAVNLIIEHRGGISAVNGGSSEVVPLPVAGIMCNRDGFGLANTYSDINGLVKRAMKSSLQAPFMTLSFMSLLVIPDLKLSDQGLFNGTSFQFTELFVNE